MSGKVLLQWRHSYCAELSRKRYMDAQSTRAMHIAIANIFFQQENEENDASTSENASGESDKHSGELKIQLFYLHYECRRV